MTKIDPVLYELVTRNASIIIAQEIIGVQPMPSNCVSGLFAIAKPERDLVAEGYEPVSELGMLWKKK